MHHAKRILRTSIVSTLLCASFIISASAAYGTGTVTTKSLRLREGAGTNTAVLATASRGTRVNVLEDQSNGWYKVDWNGTVGYMSADYLSVEVQPEANIVVGTVFTNGTNLDLRAGPGSIYPCVSRIPNETVLLITDVSNGWYKTSYYGKEGYVSSDFITLSKVVSTDEVPSAQTGSAECTGRVKTGGSGLNMRSGPGTWYGKVASIPTNTVLPISGEENGWYLVSYEGRTGYVSSDYVILNAMTSSYVLSYGAKAEEIIEYAKQFLGCPYVWGATGPNAFDCSGFTSYVFHHFGYEIDRTCAQQLYNGTAVDRNDIQPGDLILWRSYGSPKEATHVGIYIGDNQYIHASSNGSVRINDMSYGQGARYIVGIRRILN